MTEIQTTTVPDRLIKFQQDIHVILNGTSHLQKQNNNKKIQYSQ